MIQADTVRIRSEPEPIMPNAAKIAYYLSGRRQPRRSADVNRTAITAFRADRLFGFTPAALTTFAHLAISAFGIPRAARGRLRLPHPDRPGACTSGV